MLAIVQYNVTMYTNNTNYMVNTVEEITPIIPILLHMYPLFFSLTPRVGHL